MSMRINGGYFVLRKEIFDYLNEDEDLVMDACMRAAKDGRLRAAQYDGFWAPWTRSRSAARWRSNTGEGTARGHCGGNGR